MLATIETNHYNIVKGVIDMVDLADKTRKRMAIEDYRKKLLELYEIKDNHAEFSVEKVNISHDQTYKRLNRLLRELDGKFPHR